MRIFMKSLLVIIFLSSSSLAFAQNEILINGSTTVLPIVQKVSEAFMKKNPHIAISISGGGSGNGIKALTEGLCQIAMSSRDIKDAEKKTNSSTSFHKTAIAWDAIIPVVHTTNPVANLTIEQLNKIYNGTITNWKDVGGNDENIVVFSRDTSSGTYESWIELVMKKDKILRKALVQASNGAIVTSVSKNPKAIGYIGFGYVNESLKPLSVNSIRASADSIIEKKWPIARELYLFTNGAPQENVKLFIDFMLNPQEGQKLIQSIGFVPL